MSDTIDNNANVDLETYDIPEGSVITLSIDGKEIHLNPNDLVNKERNNRSYLKSYPCMASNYSYKFGDKDKAFFYLGSTWKESLREDMKDLEIEELHEIQIMIDQILDNK